MKHGFLGPLTALAVVMGTGCDGPPTDPDVPPVDPALPTEIAGTTLVQRTLQGAALVDSGAGWEGLLEELGASAADVTLSMALPPQGSTLDLQMGSLRIPQLNWAGRLDAFMAQLERDAGGAVTFDRVERGGKEVFRGLRTDDATFRPVYFYPAGDVLFFVQSAAAAVVDEALGQLPSVAAPALAAGTGAGFVGSPGAPTAFGPVTMSFLRVPTSPVCIGYADPRYEMHVAVFEGGVPVPFGTVTPIMTLGSTTPSSFSGALVFPFLYQAERWGGGAGERGHLSISTLMQATQVPVPFTVPVQHCLNGTWQDGPRILQIDQQGNAVTATIAQGTLSCGEAGQAFSGSLVTGPIVMFSGSDMKVCNPPACVEAGLLETTALRPYTAEVSDDSYNVELVWERELFGETYDDQGNLTACPMTGTESATFSIGRVTFGPGFPF